MGVQAHSGTLLLLPKQLVLGNHGAVASLAARFAPNTAASLGTWFVGAPALLRRGLSFTAWGVRR